MKIPFKIRGMIKYEISSIFEFLMKSHDQSFILESIIFKTGNVKTNLKGFRLTDDFAGSDLAVQTEKLSGISFKLWLGWSRALKMSNNEVVIHWGKKIWRP